MCPPRPRHQQSSKKCVSLIKLDVRWLLIKSSAFSGHWEGGGGSLSIPLLHSVEQIKSPFLIICLKRNIYWTPTNVKLWAEQKKKILFSRSFWSGSTTFGHKGLARRQAKTNKNTSALSSEFFKTVDETIWNWWMNTYVHTLPMLYVNAHVFALWKGWNRCFMWQWFLNLSWKKNVLFFFNYYYTFVYSDNKYSECLQC